MLSQAKFMLKSLFNSGNERSDLVKKNIIIPFGFKLISIIISLVLVPLTIGYVNKSQYGIWLTLSSLIGWFSFFDIGLGNGLKNKLAESHALGERHVSKIYISTTYALLLLIAATLFSIFYSLHYLINWNKVLNTNEISGSDLSIISIVVFGIFCAQFVSQTINTVLTAYHKVTWVSLINLLSQIGCLGIILILPKNTGNSLLLLIIVLAGLPLLFQLMFGMAFFNTSFKDIAPQLNFIELKYAKELLSIGGAFFFIQIGGLLLFQTDNILIIQLFGPDKVTIFNIAYKLFSIIIMGFAIIMTPFWSAFTDAYTKKDFNWITRVFAKMYKYWIITAVFTALLLLGSPLIFKLWLGSKIRIPLLLSVSMALYVIGTCWMMIHCYLLNGIGKIRIQLYLYIFSTIFNIPLGIYLGKRLGLVGIVYSNIIVLIMMGIILYVQCRKILNNSASGIWNT